MVKNPFPTNERFPYDFAISNLPTKMLKSNFAMDIS